MSSLSPVLFYLPLCLSHHYLYYLSLFYCTYSVVLSLLFMSLYPQVFSLQFNCLGGCFSFSLTPSFPLYFSISLPFCFLSFLSSLSLLLPTYLFSSYSHSGFLLRTYCERFPKWNTVFVQLSLFNNNEYKIIRVFISNGNRWNRVGTK